MLEQFNIALFILINQYAGINPILDSSAVLIAHYMPIPFIIGLLYFFHKGNKYREITLLSIYAAVFGLAANVVIWHFYFHPRPFMIPVGTLLFPFPPYTSFPSDHTTFMLSIALIMIYFKETRKFGALFIILGLVGGFSRVFCGIHFPLDIFGGIIIAIIITAVIYYFRDTFSSFNHILKLIYYVLK